jgi:hypothetical protein
MCAGLLRAVQQMADRFLRPSRLSCISLEPISISGLRISRGPSHIYLKKNKRKKEKPFFFFFFLEPPDFFIFYPSGCVASKAISLISFLKWKGPPKKNQSLFSLFLFLFPPVVFAR